MARALYNRETLERIRTLTSLGKGVNAIGIEIEWSAQDVRVAGKRHAIDVIEDGLKPFMTRPKHSVEAIEERELDKPKRGGGLPHSMRFPATNQENPRNKSLVLSVSVRAKDALQKVAADMQRSPGGLASVTVDYLCRAGKFAKLASEAVREMSK